MVTWDEFPSTLSAWRTAVRDHDCSEVNIHNLTTAKAASEILLKQYLALKVVWNINKTTALRDEWLGRYCRLGSQGKTRVEELNRHTMKNDPAWKAYINTVEKRDNVRLRPSTVFPSEMGRFALVLQSQLQVVAMPENDDHTRDARKVILTPGRGPSPGALHGPPGGTQAIPGAPGLRVRPPTDRSGKGVRGPRDSQDSERSSQRSTFAPRAMSDISDESATYAALMAPPARDEQIVNTAAMLFLNALFIHERRRADWTLHRKAFRFESDTVKFEARTDGHLQLTGTETSAAILEVKARGRKADHHHRIEMQESAQMALWIYQEPESHWKSSMERGKYQ